MDKVVATKEGRVGGHVLKEQSTLGQTCRKHKRCVWARERWDLYDFCTESPTRDGRIIWWLAFIENLGCTDQKV